VLRGTKHVSTEALGTIGHASEAVIRQTAAVGGKLEHAATGLGVGAIDSAKTIGVSAEDAAAAAAHGAVTAAEKLSAAAGQAVRNALTGTIGGVKDVLKR